jgi:hypothetical protein
VWVDPAGSLEERSACVPDAGSWTGTSRRCGWFELLRIAELVRDSERNVIGEPLQVVGGFRGCARYRGSWNEDDVGVWHFDVGRSKDGLDGLDGTHEVAGVLAARAENGIKSRIERQVAVEHGP